MRDIARNGFRKLELVIFTNLRRLRRKQVAEAGNRGTMGKPETLISARRDSQRLRTTETLRFSSDERTKLPHSREIHRTVSAPYLLRGSTHFSQNEIPASKLGARRVTRAGGRQRGPLSSNFLEGQFRENACASHTRTIANNYAARFSRKRSPLCEIITFASRGTFLFSRDFFLIDLERSG